MFLHRRGQSSSALTVQVMRRVQGWSTARPAAAVGAMLAAVAGADILTGPDISLAVYHLLPVGSATWFAGRLAGGVVTAAAAVTLLVTEGLERGGFHLPVAVAWELAVRVSFYLVFVVLLGELRRAYARIESLARADPLTGLPNRRAFVEAAGRELARARRLGQPISVAVLDVDDFKRINDERGHQAGDEVLCAVAEGLRSMRLSDLTARLGGDEFVILMPGTGAQEAVQALTRVRGEITRIFHQGGWAVTLSVGLATLSESPQAVEDALALADEQMYRVKRGSKDGLQQVVLKGKPQPLDYRSTH